MCLLHPVRLVTALDLQFVVLATLFLDGGITTHPNMVALVGFPDLALVLLFGRVRPWAADLEVPFLEE